MSGPNNKNALPQAASESRRNFIKVGSAMAATVGVISGTVAQPQKTRAASANGKIRIGFIGPGGRGFGAHVKTLSTLCAEGQPIELVSVCDVFSEHRDRAADHIRDNNKNTPTQYIDFREMIAKEDLDAVCIGTPDHWHAKQAIESMQAGLDVYCEKPMTKTVEEALEVLKVWRKTGRVMQVGVQSTSLPLWPEVNKLLREGKLGKVLMYQTEFFRNSEMGQWRYYKLTPGMTPKNIDWKTWLGVEDGLADTRTFDREVYAQWRRFWPFGSGMFTDLFVHRTTSMLKATGLRFPGRVVGAGGIFIEYDGRDVPDVATVVSDFNEGVQGMVTATMACQETPIQQLIRGHNGSLVFGNEVKEEMEDVDGKKFMTKRFVASNGEQFDRYQFVPERPQVTGNSKLKLETVEVGQVKDTTYDHFKNWIEAMVAKDPQKCNNPVDLGAAAITNVLLGARSYREGKVYHFNADDLTIHDGDSSWAKKWEAKSHAREKPNHIPGWAGGDTGSLLNDPEWMSLAGPWADGKDPAK
ncbi:MAG: Gfo/Idh/MocA family oxidoreductase [Pirellulaceae bacterium]|nr:Gfo/Idh/MocA family oxidoreductase [Pirellulaceae bacterium]